MNAIIEAAPAVSPHHTAPRVVAVDVFRGLTITVMVFVNELASIKGLPWWNYHAPASLDAMTYVDVVFPAFLFILGMTIPLALERRLAKGSSLASLWSHVLLRTLALVVLGLILANAELGDHARMKIETNVWAILALFGAVLFWNVYTKSERYRTLVRVLRFSGLTLMLLMLAIFRRTTPDGHAAWLSTAYAEILGLLGWTYFGVCLLYLITRRFRRAPLYWFFALTALCIATTGRWIILPVGIPHLLWPFGNGSMASIAMAGIVTSGIFLDGLSSKPHSLRRKILRATAFAGLSLIAGRLLTPLGISKIRATPTWCLYSIAISVTIFMLLYWVCDVKRWNSWTIPFRPAGENTLLTYLLPDFYYFLIAASGSTYLAIHANAGLSGVVRSLIFTALILAFSGLLTRWKIRLQL